MLHFRAKNPQFEYYGSDEVPSRNVEINGLDMINENGSNLAKSRTAPNNYHRPVDRYI